ncbi:MAG TPA: hypothetical protein VF310_09760 [Vicinamibacteria bacterium]
MLRRTPLPVALGLLTGALLSVPLFLIPFGVAVPILAGLGGVALGALCWLCLPLPLVRYLATDR